MPDSGYLDGLRERYGVNHTPGGHFSTPPEANPGEGRGLS